MVTMRRQPLPLDSAKLEALALAYVARFATSAAKCDAYLRRKLRERGWCEEVEPAVTELVTRFVDKGYIDDLGYASAKSRGLLQRGYGPKRIGQALDAAGIAAEIRLQVGPDCYAERLAALALARKRKFGPFGVNSVDRKTRDKQFAAMLRAGHGFDAARELIDAATIELAEQWVSRGEQE